MKSEQEVTEGVEIARNESIIAAKHILKLLENDQFDDAYRHMAELQVCVLSKILAVELLNP